MINMYTTLQRTRAWLWLVALLLIGASGAQAQVGNYVASYSTRSYATLSGTTTLFTPAVAATTGGLSAVVTLPFSFNYGGTSFTSMSVNQCGLMQLHNGTTTLIASTTAPGTTQQNTIAAFATTLYGSTYPGAAPLVSYKNFATDSVVIQWTDMTRSTPNDRLSFQVTLVNNGASPGTVKTAYNLAAMSTFTTTGPYIGVYGTTSQNNTMIQVNRSLAAYEAFRSPRFERQHHYTEHLYTGNLATGKPPSQQHLRLQLYPYGYGHA